MSFLSRLKYLFRPNDSLMFTVPEFMHANKNLLIIVCDPKSDRIFVGHRDRLVNGKIKSNTGKQTKVVRDVLRYSRFDKTIGDFIATLAETLNLPLLKGNQFYQFLDGAIYNIAKAVRRKRQPEAVLSPREFIKK